jgi:hypothetical protein
MDTSAIEQNAKTVQDEANKLAAPFQTLWKATLVDIPLSVLSQSLRFAGHRMQAHADHLVTLQSCHSVPELIEAQSHFMRSSITEMHQETGKIMEDVRGTMTEAQEKFGQENQHRFGKAA